MGELSRVKEALGVVRRLADAHDPLGRTLRRRLSGCGLSPPGIELALRDHLETDPSDSELEQLVRRAGRAARCHVVLSANVCTAAWRAIACALATAPEVFVCPSRRDPALAQSLAEELEPVHLVTKIDPQPKDEVHLYGSDESLAAIANGLGDVVLRTHGTGVGIAWVTRMDQAELVAEDLVPFDGRGCLSPRLVVAQGDPGAFARALSDALARSQVPRGSLDDAARAQLAQYRRTMLALGDAHEGEHHLVASDPDPETLLLPPPYRAALVVPTSADLEPLSRYVTCVGGDPPDAWKRLFPHARRAPLGSMQRPPFDGPVDLRRVSAPA